MQNQQDISIPCHVAIIPDGNRRWAQQHKMPIIEGHRRGADAINVISRHLRRRGVKTITLWGFSTENWARPRSQVEGLLKLFEGLINRYFQDALKEEVRIIHIGRKSRLPVSLVSKIQEIEQKTQHFSKNFLNIGLDYGGRDEIIRAATIMLEKARDKIKKEKLTQENFSNFLDTTGQPYPYPDIVIRTGGERRMSGFMLWQAAYSELFFLDKLFPSMKIEDIDNILKQYEDRQRRFGK